MDWLNPSTIIFLAIGLSAFTVAAVWMIFSREHPVILFGAVILGLATTTVAFQNGAESSAMDLAAATHQECVERAEGAPFYRQLSDSKAIKNYCTGYQDGLE